MDFYFVCSLKSISSSLFIDGLVVSQIHQITLQCLLSLPDLAVMFFLYRASLERLCLFVVVQSNTPSTTHIPASTPSP